MNTADIVMMIVFFVMAVVIHEYAHGYVAYKLGDSTAKHEGRLSLNPLDHIDPIGTVLLPLVLYFFTGFIFGYAKPVPVNFMNLKNPKKDMIWVGAAGPVANILMAIGIGMIAKHIFGVTDIFAKLVFVNLILAVFNMVPIPPLDGSRVLMGLLPTKQAMSYARLEPHGMLILMAILFIGPRLGFDLIHEFVHPVTLFLYKIIMF